MNAFVSREGRDAVKEAALEIERSLDFISEAAKISNGILQRALTKSGDLSDSPAKRKRLIPQHAP